MISIVVAMDKNRLIGHNNELPWHLPADLAYFKKVTMGKPIIMGRKTHESIGRPLPGRDNIIITRNEHLKIEGCMVVHSVEDILKLDKESSKELSIIGGAEIFKEVLPYTDRLYITEIDYEFKGDTYFPIIDQSKWKLISSEQGPKDEKNPYDYYFKIYDKKK